MGGGVGVIGWAMVVGWLVGGRRREGGVWREMFIGEKYLAYTGSSNGVSSAPQTKPKAYYLLYIQSNFFFFQGCYNVFFSFTRKCVAWYVGLVLFFSGLETPKKKQ